MAFNKWTLATEQSPPTDGSYEVFTLEGERVVMHFTKDGGGGWRSAYAYNKDCTKEVKAWLEFAPDLDWWNEDYKGTNDKYWHKVVETLPEYDSLVETTLEGA